MKYVRLLKEIDKHHVQEAGGKGASLGELLGVGIPVPTGFVITSGTFETFIKDTGLDAEIEAALDKVDTREMHTVENASERIHALIEKEDLPEIIKKEIVKEYRSLGAKYVAVRSSATVEDSDIAAWAGQLETYLNTTEKTLLLHVKQCWASLFSPRAIFYRFEKGFHKQKVSIAVVVQAMIESEKSGIAFSVHPVTQDENQLIIEAGFGLGEAIVSGSITPDSYVIQKDNWRLMDKQIQVQERGLYRAQKGGNEWRKLPVRKGKKPTLSDAEAIDLAKLVAKIEEHYGFPVDVEWAMVGKRVSILQSRPITTLTNKSIAAQPKPLEKFLTRDAPLMAIEHWWHKGCSEAFPAFFGFQFPKIIITKTNSAFTSYWDAKALGTYIQGFDRWFKRHPDRFDQIHKRLADGLQSFRSAKKIGRDAPLSQLKKTLNEITHHFLRGLPAVDAVHVLPSLHEELKAKNKSPFTDTHIRKLVSWREKEGNFFFNAGIDAFYHLLYAIAEKKNWQKDLIKYVRLTELEKALSNTGKLPSQVLKKRRDTAFALIDGKIVFEPDIENSLLRIGYEIASESIAGIKKLTGTSAMSGKAKGICRVIFDRSQLDRIAEGEILVAPMTSPWYIPAMKRAAAIVTDEGGVTSHAAIISREMKKPCVIGTKHATSVIRDGDMAEVDATAGEVRLLSTKPFDSSRKWVPYLTRPFNLFGASLWQSWYDSDLIKKLLGTFFPSALFIEEHLNVVRLYREPSDLSAFKAAIKKIVTKKETYLRSIFQHGFELNDEALAYINGKKKCTNLDEAVSFMIELALHATVIPNFALPLIVEMKKKSKLKKLGEELRGKSHYPKFISHVLMPLAQKKLRQLDVADPKRAIELITLQELLAGSVQELPMRIKARHELKQRFVYQKTDKTEAVSWVSDPLPLIADLENIDLGSSRNMKQLKGQVAFKGKVKGIARVILTDNTKDVRFDKGDILVSIHSSPTLMPLLLRCAAIVTDEGGISCHAAIVSRELKKPCVMSTKIATSTIKDGDLIEVDAEQGIVSILKTKAKP